MSNSAKVKQDQGWRKIDIKFLLCEKTIGLKSGVLYRTIVEAGGAHEKHFHRNSDELVYIISGKGRHGAGDEEWDIAAGNSYLNPKGVVHWTYATDPSEPLVLVGVYIAAGSVEDTGYDFVESLQPKQTG